MKEQYVVSGFNLTEPHVGSSFLTAEALAKAVRRIVSKPVGATRRHQRMPTLSDSSSAG